MTTNCAPMSLLETHVQILALRAESAALLAKLVELQNQDDNNLSEDEAVTPSPKRRSEKHAPRHSAPTGGRALPRTTGTTSRLAAAAGGGAQPRIRRESAPPSTSSSHIVGGNDGTAAAEGPNSWKSSGVSNSSGKGNSRYSASLDRPPVSTPGRPHSGSRGKSGASSRDGRGGGFNTKAASPPEWASTKSTKRVVKKV